MPKRCTAPVRSGRKIKTNLLTQPPPYWAAVVFLLPRIYSCEGNTAESAMIRRHSKWAWSYIVLLVALLLAVIRFRRFMLRRYRIRDYRMTVIMIAVAVTSHGRFVMVTKPEKYRRHTGRWAFPQGGVGKYEVPLLAFLREFKEEIGVALHKQRRRVGFAGRIIRIRKKDERRWKRGKAYQPLLIEFFANRLFVPRPNHREISGALWIAESLHTIDDLLQAMREHDKAKLEAYRTALQAIGWRST